MSSIAPRARRIVLRRDQENDADRDDRDALEYAQRAWLQQQHVLREQREAHQPAADGESRNIDDAP